MYIWSDRYDVNSAIFEISAQARTRLSRLFSSRTVSGLQTGCGRRLAIMLHHSSVQVAIRHSRMNFAVRELRICCPITSLSRWVINWQKFALNVKGKVNNREQAQRPW